MVVDRQPAAGMETSFANAGQVSPGYSAPWSAPGIPIKAMKWLMMKHRPLVLWPRTELRLWGWLAHMLANCTEEAYRRNKSRMVALAEYSRDCLRELRQEIGITYDHREQGLLQLFRTQKQLDGIGEDTAVLDVYGVPYEILDPAGCVGVEPALRLVRGKVAGGLRLLGDELGMLTCSPSGSPRSRSNWASDSGTAPLSRGCSPKVTGFPVCRSTAARC
jgi:D-amino-acid dehydrogenase